MTLTDMRDLTLPASIFRLHRKSHQGVFSFIVHNPEMEQVLDGLYGRSGLCLKVFKREIDSGGLSSFIWGRVSGNGNLAQCTRIQNLFAYHGVAPRIYDIVTVNGTRFAQVTEFASGDGEWRREKAKEINGLYYLRNSWDMNPKNWVGGKLVDFQAYKINEERYLADLSRRCYERAAWGSRTDPYQGVDFMGFISQRDHERRAELMRLDEIDFTGKTVLDIGCNLGSFVRDALDRGAKRAVGVELPHVAEVAFEVANWSGHWNTDFLGLRLPALHAEIARVSGIEQFDVIYALSVQRQIGLHDWMLDLCRGVFYFEGHVPDQEHTYRPWLEERFGTVEFLGASRDHGPRPVFRCAKEPE